MNNFIVDNLEIPFNNEWSNIAVSISGGADSALLAYLLCKHITDNKLPIDIAFISHVRMWKTRPWQRYNSLDVYSYFLRTFKNIHFERYENFIAPDIEWGNIGPTFTDEYGKPSSGDIAEIRSYSEYICYYENVDAYYNGVSHNPRSIDLGGMEKRNVEPTEENQYLRLTTHMNKTVVHPFRFIEKDWIIRQYNLLQLSELLNNTRSCEGEFPDINYTTYTPGQYVPICNECFWCKERSWAIEQSK
jgi:hypothetical protein